MNWSSFGGEFCEEIKVSKFLMSENKVRFAGDDPKIVRKVISINVEIVTKINIEIKRISTKFPEIRFDSIS